MEHKEVKTLDNIAGFQAVIRANLTEATIECLLHCCPVLILSSDTGFADSSIVIKANMPFSHSRSSRGFAAAGKTVTL